MKIYSLKLENWMLFKKFYKTFHDKQIIGIEARHKENKKKNNQSGKTSIVEAIVYALAGICRADEKTLIHFGEEFLKVTLVLIDADGTKYTIIRGRDSKGKGLLSIDFEEKSRDSQKAIFNLIGLNKSDIELSCYFKQSDINQFANKGPSDMKATLTSWVQENNHWLAKETRAKEKFNQAKKDLESLKTTKETLAGTKLSTFDIKDEIQEAQDALKSKKSLSKKCKIKLDLVNSSSMTAKKFEELIEKRNNRINKSDKVKKRLERDRELVGIIAKLKEELVKKIGETDLTLEDKDKYETFVNRYKLKLKQAQEKFDSLEDNSSGICPVINETCDRICFTDSERSELQNEMSSFKLKIKKYKKNLEVIAETKDIADAIRNGTSELVNRKELKAEIVEIQKEIDSYATDIEAYNPDANKLIKKYKSELEDYGDEIEELNSSLGELEYKLKSNKDLVKKIKKIDEQIAEKHIEVQDLNYVAKMFGKNGIPSLELENSVGDLEDQINYVLSKLDPSMSVHFDSERELNKMEDYCLSCGFIFPKNYRKKECTECDSPRKKKVKDEIQLMINQNGTSSDFSLRSGGGQVLISTAVRIGLTRLLQQQRGSNFPILFLDEPDKALDEFNAAMFMKLVTQTLIKKLGFSQIFWISQNKDISGSIEDVLRVTRYEDYSKAHWV